MKTVLRMLFGNLPLKFAALAFAFGIWTAVRMNIETPAKDVPVELEIVKGDEDFQVTITHPRDGRVSLDVVGGRDEVLDFKAGPRLLVDVRADALQDRQNQAPIHFTYDEVRLPPGTPKGLKIRGMNPSEIVVEVVRLGNKPDIVVRPPELRGVEQIPEASFRIADYTPKLVARGRWEQLKDVSSVNAYVSEKTLRRLVDRLGSQTSHSYSGVPVQLQVGKEVGDWRDEFEIIDPLEIVAKVEVTSEVEREFWVPIHIDYRGTDAKSDGVLRFVAEAAGPNRWTESTGPDSPPKVLLPFAGSPREIARFQDLVDKGQVTAFVLANDVNADDGFANLRVRIEMSGQWKGVTPRYAKFPLVGVETIK